MLYALNCTGQYIGTNILIDNTIINTEVYSGISKIKRNITIKNLSPIPSLEYGIEGGLFTDSFDRNTERELIDYGTINIFARIFGEIQLTSKFPLFMRIEYYYNSTSVGAVFYKKEIDDFTLYAGALHDSKDGSRLSIGFKYKL